MQVQNFGCSEKKGIEEKKKKFREKKIKVFWSGNFEMLETKMIACYGKKMIKKKFKVFFGSWFVPYTRWGAMLIEKFNHMG